MLIKIKARGWNRTSERFVDKWLESCSRDDEQGLKDLKKVLWKYMLAEAEHNKGTLFRLVITSDDDDDENEGTLNFDSPSKKRKKKYEDEDDEDDE